MKLLVLGLTAAALVPRFVSAQNAPLTSRQPAAACRVVRAGVEIPCPTGWMVLDENEREVVIANFQLGHGVTKNTRTGADKATISVSTLPRLYRNLGEWLFAGHKNAPEAVETRFVVKGSDGREISVVCLASAERSGPIFSRYFFQVGKTPALIEVMYRANDPKREEYQSAARHMIETAAVR